MTDSPLTSRSTFKLILFSILFIPTALLGIGAIPAIFLLAGLYLMRRNADFSYFKSAVFATKAYLAVGVLSAFGIWLYASYPYFSGLSHKISGAQQELQELEFNKERGESNYRRATSFPLLREENPERHLESIEDGERRIALMGEVSALRKTLDDSLAGRVGLDREDTYLDEHWWTDDFALGSAAWIAGFLVYLWFVHVLLWVPLKSHQGWVTKNGFLRRWAGGNQAAQGKPLNIIKAEKLKAYSVAEELTKWAALKQAGHITEEEFAAVRAKLLTET